MDLQNTSTINVITKTKTHQMKKEEYARWLCLIEAIDLVEQKAVELKADITADDFWVKPLAFQKYIEQRLETMILDVEREEFNVDIKATSIPKYVELESEEQEPELEPDITNLDPENLVVSTVL